MSENKKARSTLCIGLVNVGKRVQPTFCIAGAWNGNGTCDFLSLSQSRCFSILVLFLLLLLQNQLFNSSNNSLFFYFD